MSERGNSTATRRAECERASLAAPTQDLGRLEEEIVAVAVPCDR